MACSSDVELTVGKGIGYEFTANEAVVAGEVLYFGSNGKVALADADALNTSAVIAIALEGGAADDTILCNTMYGAIIDIELASTETFNRGVAIYLDEMFLEEELLLLLLQLETLFLDLDMRMKQVMGHSLKLRYLMLLNSLLNVGKTN